MEAYAAEIKAQTAIDLERGRNEVNRLRSELASTIAEAHKRAEAERAENHILLERERGEVNKLRSELLSLVIHERERSTTNQEVHPPKLGGDTTS
ncbi:hypothetical protein EPA93_43275 [Ktedonosporobacter rubrisoli]|uniref:Uncharacterized protein n=1 Tax=Ktedonosporobacter rubrisoli TaxID=2509675 RepID=A0A4P6K2J8_KTERU|nr:hypothetical protein [Ktedonosporobacter rubrisoli]QBD82438.1 hypothetical protein EPA93_43275 [Ktedonosporobacter rubrisoli]